MANSKHVERRLARLEVKYAIAGGSPRKLRRIAEVNARREQKAADAKNVTIEVKTGPATDALINALVATTAGAESEAFPVALNSEMTPVSEVI